MNCASVTRTAPNNAVINHGIHLLNQYIASPSLFEEPALILVYLRLGDS